LPEIKTGASAAVRFNPVIKCPQREWCSIRAEMVVITRLMLGYSKKTLTILKTPIILLVIDDKILKIYIYVIQN